MTISAALLAIALTSTPVIVAQGDSLTYGQDTRSPAGKEPINGATQRRAKTTYPDRLNQDLPRGSLVVNLGFPGDRASDGLARWRTRPANVVILMYGSNDAFNFGHRPGGAATVGAFESMISSMVTKWRRTGARILIVAAPPLPGWWQDRKLDPYRDAAWRAAKHSGSSFIKLSRPSFDAWSDDVHFNNEGYAWLADQIAPCVKSILLSKTKACPA